MQFALFAGLIITALLLNTAVFVLSILLLYTLPAGVTGSVVSYAGILIGLTLLAWLILLGGGAAILHQERDGHSSMPLKLGIMISVLLLYTVVFLLSCILLSVFQNDLQTSLVPARNYTASVLALIFVAWVLLLTGSALLAKKPAVVVMDAPAPAPATRMPVPLPYTQPLIRWPEYPAVESSMRGMQSPSMRGMQSPSMRRDSPYSYGMTRGRTYSMCSAE